MTREEELAALRAKRLEQQDETRKVLQKDAAAGVLVRTTHADVVGLPGGRLVVVKT